MLLFLFLACAPEPVVVPSDEAAPSDEPAADKPHLLAVGPVPSRVKCTLADGTVAALALVSRFEGVADFTLGDETVRIDSTIPGWKPYEYTGGSFYRWSLSFEASGASWIWSVDEIHPDPARIGLTRTRDGVTEVAPCTATG